MIPEKVFQQILALGDAWRVKRMDYVEKEQKVLIQVEDTPALWAGEVCPHCLCKSVRGYDHAPERELRDYIRACDRELERIREPDRPCDPDRDGLCVGPR